MKRKLLSSVLLVGTLVGFSGCGGKILVKKDYGEIQNQREAIVMFREESSLQSTISNKNNIRLLQVMAEETIASNYQYFAFEKAKEPLLYGINSTDEFLLKCTDRTFLGDFGKSFVPFGVFLLNWDSCQLNLMPNGNISGARFSLYKEKPSKVTLDANEVIANLKARKLYVDDKTSIDYVKDSFFWDDRKN
jgi:hypothetical protein